MTSDVQILNAFERWELALRGVAEAQTVERLTRAEQQRDEALAKLERYKAGVTRILVGVGMSPEMAAALLLELEGNVILLDKAAID